MTTRACIGCGGPFTYDRRSPRRTRCAACSNPIANRPDEVARLVAEVGREAAAVELGVHPDSLRRAIRTGRITPAPAPVPPPAPAGWRDAAACRDTPDVDFFADDPRPARRVCRACPVAAECLAEGHRADALDALAGLGHGVWGGYTARERAGMRSSPTAPRLTSEERYAAAMRERFPTSIESEAS